MEAWGAEVKYHGMLAAWGKEQRARGKEGGMEWLLDGEYALAGLEGREGTVCDVRW